MRQLIYFTALLLAWDGYIPGPGAGGGSGTVTSTSFTGGLISVATPTTTPALTVAGTSGGIPYFNSASTWASSALLTQYGLLYGGGAGATPVATAAGPYNTIAQVEVSGGAGVPNFDTVYGQSPSADSCTSGSTSFTGQVRYQAIALANTLTCTITITATYMQVGVPYAITFTQGATTPTTSIVFSGATVHGGVIAAGTVNQIATMFCMVTSTTGPVLACVSSVFGN
jgi:hypothetical protein